MDVEGLLRPVVEAAGLELVEAALHREQGRRVLRITVDREGGVDLEALSDASERLSRRLDLEGFDPGPYSLEVSSPGLERPLYEPRDFARRIGQRVKVKTATAVDGRRTLSGTILGAEGEQLKMATDGGEVKLSFKDITSARTVFEWGSAR